MFLKTLNDDALNVLEQRRCRMLYAPIDYKLKV